MADAVELAIGGAGGVVSVHAASFDGTQSVAITGAAFFDVTNLSVTFTPASNTNRVLLYYNLNGGVSSGSFGPSFISRLVRGTTPIAIGASPGSRTAVTAGQIQVGTSRSDLIGSHAATFLDSPNTASPVTYKVQMGFIFTTTVLVNRTADDTNSDGHLRGVCNLVAVEVKV